MSFSNRIRLVAALYALLVAVLIGRLFQLQIVRGAYYLERSETKILDLRVVRSWRGDIVDRNGNILATDALSWDAAILFEEYDKAIQETRELVDLLKLPSRVVRHRPESFLLKPYWQSLNEEQQFTAARWLADTMHITSDAATALLSGKDLHLPQLRAAIIQHRQNQLVENLATLFGMSSLEVSNRIEEKRDALQKLIDRRWESARVWRSPQVFMPAITREQAQKIELRADRFPNVMVDSSLRREYPLGPVCSHILGYVNRITAKEYEARKNERHQLEGFERQKVHLDDLVGRTALEKVLEDSLRGEDGLALVERNARGVVLKTITERPPVAGATVALTLDTRLQTAAFEQFRRRNVRGALAVIDVRSGEVLTLVTYPSFDNNWFISPTESDELRELFSASDTARIRQPLVNRATAAVYPPGSAIKIFIAMAALEKGIISPAHTAQCYWGAVSTYGSKICNGTHHDVDILTSIQRSCNIFYYELGGMIGIDRMAPVLREYGLGTPTGLELSRGTKGLVGDRDWKSGRFRDKWYASETEDIAIGQGFIQVSPLQLARFNAAVANGGRLYDCQLVKSINGKPKKASYQDLHFNTLNLNLVRRGMRMVCQPGGTASASGVGQYGAAGKTGTAQVAGKEPHAWFAGFAPYDHPEIAFACIVENGGHGGDAAAPIVAQFLRDYFNPPKPEEEETENSETPQNKEKDE